MHFFVCLQGINIYLFYGAVLRYFPDEYLDCTRDGENNGDFIGVPNFMYIHV